MSDPEEIMRILKLMDCEILENHPMHGRPNQMNIPHEWGNLRPPDSLRQISSILDELFI
jgi:hypothetical protein